MAGLLALPECIMNDNSYSDEAISRFLLRQLPDAESDAIEAKFFTDAEYFERICEVENQLVDRYIRGRLSPRERELFERNYLITPARRQKVAFAKSLTRATAQVQTAAAREVSESREKTVSRWQSFLTNLRSSSWVPQVAMAMAVILLIGGLWAGFKINTLRRDLIAANQERNRFEQSQQELRRQIEELERQLATSSTQSDELTKELERLREQQKELEKQGLQPLTGGSALPSIASFLLLPGSVRGGEGAKTLVIKPEIDTLRLRIKLDSNDYSTYLVQVRTVDGSEVFSQQGLKAQAVKQQATLSIKIPAKKLPGNDYILTLSGVSPANAVEEVERYFFRVKVN
jgi:hypothetical protein